MKDLKENIQKNNMKKLVLSVVLGMFCYCTNNAMKKEPEAPPVEVKNIDDVLGIMIVAQIWIFKASEAIKGEKKNIYATIKNAKGKVTKESLLKFFQKQIPAEFTPKEVKANIEYLEQYFHLKGKNNEYECTKDNLTEIFWEEQKEGKKINEKKKEIREYLLQITGSEYLIRKCFKIYYKVKETEKTEKGEVCEKKEIIKEIMKECCDTEEEGNIHHKFLTKLGKLYEEKEKLKELLKEEHKEKLKEYLKDKKKAIIEAIKRRITLDEEIKEETLENFIKQKIKPLDKKDKDPIKGGCSCCNDCCGNE